ncbi:SDR family oxidoreductase [Akkermansiaceae bacterium]|nr:SDR family oxidoreductase [Akkermansiaceae bacterium]
MNRKITNSRVLVTGGAGFIGSNLIEALLQQDNEVVCLDNFSTSKRENITPFLESDYFTLNEGDIRDPKVCAKACEGVDYVLHQAALGSVPRSINDPVTTDQVNCGGFVTMLVAAREAKVKRVVYAGSSSTYGDSDALPKVEDVIGRPLSPYAVTKYVNEMYADVFAKTYGMEIIGLRYFNVFGRRQNPYGAYAAVIPKFAIALMKGESPHINGDGTHSRDFTYIDNVVQINQLAATTENKDAINKVYNTAFGEQTTLNELFEALRNAMAKSVPAIAKLEATYGEVRQGDIPHSLADISKARALLDYNPQFSMAQGLNEAAEWYLNNLVV